MTDVLEDKNLDAAVVAKFCFEFNGLFDKYRKLIEDPEFNTKLTMDDFREIKAKKDFIQLASTQVATLAANIADETHKDLDVAKLITMSEAARRSGAGQPGEYP